MRTRPLELGYLSHCSSRLESAHRFSKSPTCREPENERSRREETRKLPSAAQPSTRAPGKKNERDKRRNWAYWTYRTNRANRRGWANGK